MTTLRDIAKITGVSASTISRVLNEQPEGLSVAEEIRRLIFQTAEQLNYTRQRKPRPFGKNSIRKIAVIGWFNEEHGIAVPYYSQLRRGIELECRSLGFDASSVVFEWSDFVRSYAMFSQCDGVVVIGANEEAHDYFAQGDQRVVFIDHSPDPVRFSSVVIDFALGTKQALTHLIELGYTSIGYFGGSNELSRELPRSKMVREFLTAKNLYNPDHVHLEGDWTAKTGYEMAQQRVRDGNLARSYFVANDPMAVGAMTGFLDSGLRIPEDVAIVGFDDIIEMASYVRPRLTTVHAPIEYLGKLGVDLLVNGLSDNSIPVSITLPTTLTVRESCGARLVTAGSTPVMSQNRGD